MASERDHYVLVPDASRGALLVAGSGLPCVRGARGAGGVLDALRREYGLDAPYLRPAQFLIDAEGNAFAGLHELDVRAPTGSRPPVRPGSHSTTPIRMRSPVPS